MTKTNRNSHKNDIFKNPIVHLKFSTQFIFIILIFCVFKIENGESMFGNSGRTISSSNYLTVSRTSLKRGSVITLTPKGWLSRAIKGVRTGTFLFVVN